MTRGSRLTVFFSTLACVALLAVPDAQSPARARTGMAAAAQKPPSVGNARYLDYAKASADWAWDHRE